MGYYLRLLRQGVELPLALLISFTLSSCNSKETPQTKWLTIIQDGAWEREIEISGLKPGDYEIRLGSGPFFYYPWQGEDSIDYLYSNDFLWVNGKIVGVDLDEADYSQIPEPGNILTVSGYRIDTVTLDLKRLPNLTVATVGGVYDGNVKNLKTIPRRVKLYVYGNDISNRDLMQLSRLSNIRGLCLDLDNVTEKGITYLGRFKNLRELLIWNFPDLNEELKYISKIRNLQTLELSGGVLDEAGMEYLVKLNNLRELTLYHIEFHNVDVSQLRTLRFLRLFESVGVDSLDELWITKDIMDQLSELPNLHVLSLESVYISAENLESIRNFKSLRELKLMQIEHTERLFEHLKELKDLHKLYVFRSRIGSKHIIHLKEIPELRYLGLPENAIRDDDLLHLADIKNLERLELRDNYITDKGLPHLSSLGKLRALDLKETNVTKEGVERLQKTLPDCKIKANAFYD